jgi:hypothetical protein
MQIQRDSLKVARVLQEDDEFITLEVAKNDDASFYVAAPDGIDAPPQVFLTLLFVRRADKGVIELWTPWDDDAPDG